MSDPIQFVKMPADWCRESLQYREGLVFSAIPFSYEFTFQRFVLKDVVRVFPDITSNVSMFYLYDMDAQSRDSCFWWSDGVRTMRYLPTGEAYCMVGVAIQAVDSGIAYCQMMLLHELAHILVLDDGGSHSARFYETMNSLIRRFNRETGSKLVNDYNRGKDAPQRRKHYEF